MKFVYLLATLLVAGAATGCMTPRSATFNSSSLGHTIYPGPGQYAAASGQYPSGAANYPHPATPAAEAPLANYPTAAAAYTAPSTYNAQVGPAALPSQTSTPYHIGQPLAGRYSAEQLSAWAAAAKSGTIGRSSSRGRKSTPC